MTRFLIVLFLISRVPTGLAQEIKLYELGAPQIKQLYDVETGKFSGPPGEWVQYMDRINGGWTTDQGILSAIIDSGVSSSHPLIAPVLVESIDLTGEGPEDRVGHGTFVALISLSMGEPSPLISIKVFGDKVAGNGAKRLERALRLAAARGAKIANLSVGVDLMCANSRDPDPPQDLVSCEETSLCRTVTEVTREPGLLVVAAVGNDPTTTGCPACCKDALAVGGAGPEGQRSPNSGQFADILAPNSVPLVELGTAQVPK